MSGSQNLENVAAHVLERREELGLVTIESLVDRSVEVDRFSKKREGISDTRWNEITKGTGPKLTRRDKIATFAATFGWTYASYELMCQGHDPQLLPTTAGATHSAPSGSPEERLTLLERQVKELREHMGLPETDGSTSVRKPGTLAPARPVTRTPKSR